MKTRFTLLTALLLMPLAALPAAERATFVREPHVVIKHGVNDGRYFIGPGMFVLKDGSVLMAAPWGRPPANVFEGIVNKHPVPMLYRSTDAGETWQELGRPEVKWRHSGFVSDGGVSFLRLQDGRIAMALHRHAAGLKGGALPVICFSSDEGKTWTDPALIGDFGDEGAWYVMNDRLIQTRTGRLVQPVAHAVGRYEGDRDESLVFFSDDGGASWNRSQPAPLPEGPRGMAEPCVVELNDGRLMLLARGGLGVLVKCYSSDGGETWTQGARTTLVSPCSSLTLHRLPDSRLIVFYNHATPYNAGDFFPRNPLCYALSADEGDSWSEPVIIDDSGVSDGNGGKPSLQIVYPGAAFLKEGILLFYSRDVTKNTFKTTKGETFVWTEAQRALTGGVTCLLAYPAAATKAKPADECDICIYGGTSGGVVAAVQAARMGKSVVLVEPGRHLGGMMAGGLSWSDVGSAERAKLFGGLAREVFERIGKHYGQDPKTVFEVTAPEGEGRSRKGVDFIRPPSLAFEPKVAEKVFTEMAREAGVQVRFGAAIESVAKDGTRLQKLKLNDGTSIAAKVFMDATYEGDLMARTGVSYTLGRESNAQYGEKGNGVRGPEHGPATGKFPVKIDPFVNPGDPTSGLLPLIAGDAPEPVGSADKRIQSYNYRLCLTDDPANRVPLDPPANYDPADWELLGRYIEAMKAAGTKLTLRNFCKYDPLPNRKYDFNNRWPISTDLLGGADGWPEGSAADRVRIAKAHEDYLRGFFHFLRTDPRVPENVREETARFGLPRDEFTDNGHWPHQIYVREARRMVSDLVMTEHHIRNQRVAPNPVSLATYPMDIHAVRRVYQDGKLYNEGFGEGSGRPAPIGYGAIIPQAAECENLFVTFALSASHAAFGSIRMEPVFMVSSQSAATAACLAIDADASVQDVDQVKLRARLLADGQILAASSTPAAASHPKIVKASRLPGIVMDDDKAEYQGDWMLSNAQPTPIGGYYRHDGNTDRGKKNATFTATVLKAGDYEIRFLYSPHDNRSTKTKVTVTGAGEEKTFRINQREPVIKNGVPNALGVFRIEAGAKVRVTVSNEGADSYVVVDGLQILPVEIAREERAGKRPSGYAMSKAVAPPTPSGTPQRKPLKVQPVRSSSAADVRGKTYDVVVIGGTPGGIACSVRAAREGLTVLLVQHNRHIGGMLTSGLMQWDALYGGPRSPLFNEYAKSIEDYYRETYGPDSPQFQKARYTQQHYPMSLFECGVAEHVFNGLVSAESNITTLLSHYPAEIQREGGTLRSLTLREYGTRNDITVTGVTYVDATYEGDLAALAKVPYRVGREGRDEYDEPHAGKLFTNISKEAGSQDAKAGKLNLRLYGHSQGTVDPKSPRTADRAVQAYNYRFSLSNEPGNIRLPKKPPGYNREEYVDYYRRFMGAGRLNGKASFNAAILPGENHAYPEATWPEREKIIERHKNFALGLMWFLQNDESVRPESRERYRSIGLPLDEFPDNDNVPYEMYVREARRIVGRDVFTEHDNRAAPGLTRPPIHADSVAFTDWAMDSHDCTWDRSPGYAYDGKLILTEESRPAQIPWRSLLPQDLDNLIVPVCLGATHVAWGAVRLEPVWMMTGEAAGLAAALARRQGVTPGQLDADLLQRALCEKRHFVSFFNDLEAAADHPAMPAAQYFAARGFFPDYNARLDEPLTESVRGVWGEGLTALREGRLDAMAFAKKVKQAEAADSLKLKRTRGEAMLSMWRVVSSVWQR
ncbi:MAG: FAD-dependent oxidoreductase [Chloroflexi bacterium]|nr:FAD-dependent oxidoreductase [Chloroflexota bacterium]